MLDTLPRDRERHDMTTKHVAIYSRVSSKRQDTRSQEPDLSNWVMSECHKIKPNGFADKNFSVLA
jgi:hypothetical protein